MFYLKNNGGGEWVGGEKLTKAFTCIYAQPTDTDNSVGDMGWGEMGAACRESMREKGGHV